MMQNILVVGSGIAGLSCAKLLARHGWDVNVCDTISPTVPALVINNATCNLLQDIWNVEENDLFEGAYVIEERKIRWGKEGAISTIKQPSLVISGTLLVKHLLECLAREHKDQIHLVGSEYMKHLVDPISLRQIMHSFTWIIDASGRASCIAKILADVKHQSFGRRCIITMMVKLANSIEQNLCWMEAVPKGWVFLAPIEKDRALIQAMVPMTPSDPSLVLMDLLGQTQIIKTCVSDTLGDISIFKAFPKISAPLCGQGWITVGDSAVSFDPISGDGIGYALREAILATGAINAIASGLSMSDCLHHYTLRLYKTFLSHLRECYRYYYSGGFLSSEWKYEIKLIEKIFSSSLEYKEEFKLGLRGFILVPLKEELNAS
jgi:flavin-dependent dehydrogenase